MASFARCCLPRSPGQPQHLKYQNRIWKKMLYITQQLIGYISCHEYKVNPSSGLPVSPSCSLTWSSAGLVTCSFCTTCRWETGVSVLHKYASPQSHWCQSVSATTHSDVVVLTVGSLLAVALCHSPRWLRSLLHPAASCTHNITSLYALLVIDFFRKIIYNR